MLLLPIGGSFLKKLFRRSAWRSTALAGLVVGTPRTKFLIILKL